MPTMMRAIANRGPDDEGVWYDERVGLAFGHRRLAIVDLSPFGRQPMRSASGRYTIVYNGEIYNHLQVRASLEAAGKSPTWRGHSDTETLIACIDTWGLEEALQRCVGMFALALWDAEEGTISLARDRFGEKPLYYGWQGRTFLFASDLSALIAHPEFERRIDRHAIALFLQHNYIPAPHSIWRGIRKLPAGTYLTIRPGSFELSEPVPFWSLATIATAGTQSPLQLSDEEATDQLEKRLCTTIREQMTADVPLGALLSGGIDSSIVVALMQAQSSHPIRTFSIGFREKDFDESGHAEAVAQHLRTNHTTLFMSSEQVRDAIPTMSDVYSEPFADSSQVPTSIVMKLARQHVTVALSGDGGDELFGGYDRYRLAKKLWSIISRIPPAARTRGVSSLLRLQHKRREWKNRPKFGAKVLHVEDRLYKLAERLEGVEDFDDFYLSLLTEWPRVQSMVHGSDIEGESLLRQKANWPPLGNRLDRMMALDALTYLPDDIMVKVDRAAMSVSLETRAPFLDHRLVEFVWRLPLHQKTRPRSSKWLLRKVLYRHVPKELIERPKMGFAIPLDEWLRGPLREWAEELLRNPYFDQMGLVNAESIRSTWKAHISGTRRFGYRLWTVLMLESWLRTTAKR